jgi:hypothetical protein
MDTENEIKETKVNTESVKYCKDLLGLCFTEPYCEYSQYFHAFSFNRECLEQMIKNNVKEDEQKYYSIKNIKLLKHLSVPILDTDTDTDTVTVFTRNGIKIKSLLLLYKDQEYNEELFPIYGFNRIKNDMCEQVLLAIKPEYITEYIKECGISHNSIQIDTFYAESILNA